MSNNIENNDSISDDDETNNSNTLEFNPKTKNDKFKVDCWHSNKNGSITPRDINKKSHKMCWFTCDVCAHNFKDKIINIIYKNNWCPYCEGNKLCDDDECDICYKNSFASFG